MPPQNPPKDDLKIRVNQSGAANSSEINPDALNAQERSNLLSEGSKPNVKADHVFSNEADAKAAAMFADQVSRDAIHSAQWQDAGTGKKGLVMPQGLQAIAESGLISPSEGTIDEAKVDADTMADMKKAELLDTIRRQGGRIMSPLESAMAGAPRASHILEDARQYPAEYKAAKAVAKTCRMVGSTTLPYDLFKGACEYFGLDIHNAQSAGQFGSFLYDFGIDVEGPANPDGAYMSPMSSPYGDFGSPYEISPDALSRQALYQIA